VSLAHVDELVAALPDGRSVVLGTGHDVHAERPAEFTSALASFLDAPATG
jgi:pimeloyl-ACP methyl ester carboxylesterase